MALLGRTEIHAHQGGTNHSNDGFNQDSVGFHPNGGGATAQVFFIDNPLNPGGIDQYQQLKVTDGLNYLFNPSGDLSQGIEMGNSESHAIGLYLKIYNSPIESDVYEIMRINWIGGINQTQGQGGITDRWIGIWVERARFGTIATAHLAGNLVEIHSNAPPPFNNEPDEDLTPETQILVTNDIVQDSVSPNWGIPGISIQQTLLNPFDVYSGLDIDTGSFQNTNQGLKNSNQDGRIELGMFSFDDDNIAENNFPDILPNPFRGLVKRNMVNNGDCQFVEKNLVTDENDVPAIIWPQGGWGYMSLGDVRGSGFATPENYISDFFDEDNQLMTGYGGYYAYIPLNRLAYLSNGETPLDNEINYWGDINSVDDLDEKKGYLWCMAGLSLISTNIPGTYETKYPLTQNKVNNHLSSGQLDDLRDFYKWSREGLNFEWHRDDENVNISDLTWNKNLPHIAFWMTSKEAYSNDRCLCFMNFQIWDKPYQYQITSNNSDDEHGHVFNYFFPFQPGSGGSAIQRDSIIINNNDYSENNITATEHQYRVLNQMQKIYDKFDDEKINPYSSLKIRFKMKTTCCLPPTNDTVDSDTLTEFIRNPLNENLGYAPKIEVGVLHSQFQELPKAGRRTLQSIWTGANSLFTDESYFKSPGGFNSINYPNSESEDFDSKNYSRYGGMSRFQNSVIDEWEQFEFDFNLTDEHLNHGRIHGVRYGGTFNDSLNNGPVEIMLDTSWDGSSNIRETVGTGQIYFKRNDNNESPYQEEFWIVPPAGVVINQDNSPGGDGASVRVKHGFDNQLNMNTVDSGFGEHSKTGYNPNDVDDDKAGTSIYVEAYLMYVGSQFQAQDMSMESYIGYGYEGADNENADMIVAYWDGEHWSYDGAEGYLGSMSDSDGYDTSYFFTPTDECFIIARLYAGEKDKGISGIDQYISNQSEFPTDGVGNLFLFLQSGNDFHGRVLIDDIECYESYEFTPDVDVRKKISNGNYGIADLTQYYDKDLQPNAYKDTTAPLEVQFYFYPQYPTNETFVERTPIYQDFKKGRFYIYDVNWGDGSINEFTQPEQIDEDTALYHTYETNGVFEVTGTMLRVKVDNNGEIVGVAYNKKFKLKININPGLDEDFRYFASDGYSFIPYKNTTPIIGGISDQSNYYKKTKRQIGFLNNNEKISIDFKNNSDKLKTELALLKMENQNLDDLEVLPAYMEQRFDDAGYFRQDNWLENVQKNGAEELATYIKDYFSITTNSISIEAWNAGRFQQQFFINYNDDVTPPENQIMPQLTFGGEENTVQTVLDWLDGDGFDGYEGWVEPHGVWYYFNMGLIYVVSNNVGGHNIQMPIVRDELIYNGISPIKEELGKGIGDCDLSNIKFYNTPKSIWEMFGFEDEDLLEVGTPDNPRYWKNIIPQDYSIFNRDGIVSYSNNPIAQTQRTVPDIKLFIFAPDDDGYVPIYYTSNEDLTQIQLYGLPLSTDYGGEAYHNVDMGDVHLDYQNGEFPSMKVLSFHTGDASTNNGMLMTAGDYQVSRAHINPEDINDSQQNFRHGLSRMQEGVTDVPHVFPRTDLPKLLMKIRFRHQSSVDYSSGEPINLPEEQYIAYQDRWLPADFISDMPQVGEFYVYNNGTQVATGIEPGPDFPAYLTYDSNGMVIGGGTDMNGLFNHIMIGDFTGQSYTIYFHPNQYSPGIFELEVEEDDDNVITDDDNDDLVIDDPIEDSDNSTTFEGIDTYANQDWIDINEQLGFGHKYYYPVLPKYGANGRFVDIKTDEDNNVISGYPMINNEFKIPHLNQGNIIDEDKDNTNILISVDSEKIEVDVLNDKSGNQNYGFAIGDFSPLYDDETLMVKKTKQRTPIKTSKQNGAF